MRHPTEGVLRRLLDEPAGVPDDDREHAAACDDCLRALSEMRADARLVEGALAPPKGAGVDVHGPWLRLSGALDGAEPHAGRAPRRRTRFRDLLRRPMVAGLAVALVLGGAGTAAANNWFQIFRTERVAPIVFSAADLNALPDLRAYGEVEVSGAPDVHVVADAAAAAAESGLRVPEVTIRPRGVSGEPIYQVGRQVSATFTFSAERAARAAAAAGEPLPPPPAGLDGSSVRFVAGPGLVAIWQQQAGVPSMVVGRAVPPQAFSSGVPFEVVRDYLVSLPGVSDRVTAQLRTFGKGDSTLPLPVPDGATSAATVRGAPATVLKSPDGTFAAVVWVADGTLTAVAGPLTADEVLSVARGLR